MYSNELNPLLYSSKLLPHGINPLFKIKSFFIPLELCLCVLYFIQALLINFNLSYKYCCATANAFNLTPA